MWWLREAYSDGGSEERQYRDCGRGKNLNQHGCALVSKVGSKMDGQEPDRTGPGGQGGTFRFYARHLCTALLRGMM